MIEAAILGSVLVFAYDAWSVAAGHHLLLVTLVAWPLWTAAAIGGLLWLGLWPSRLRSAARFATADRGRLIPPRRAID